MRQQTRFFKGFTLIELMVTIAIIAVVTTVVTPTALNQQMLSIRYANTALQQARSYTNMINDNYTNYYTQAQNGQLSIPYSTVVSNGYNGALTTTDIYGAMPCVTIQYNTTSNKLRMFMYYVGGNAIQNNVIYSATNYLHGIAGQLNGSTYLGPYNIWNIPVNQVASSCGNPQNGSMLINLNLLTTQISQMQGDASLHRVPDVSGIPMGADINTNSMQTDIIMGYNDTSSGSTSYNGIYFTSGNTTNYPYLTSGANSNLASPYNTGMVNDVVTANAGLVANAFLPALATTSWSTCSSSDLGEIVVDATSKSVSTSASDLQCRYDTVNCASPYYCYLPMSSSSTVHINQQSTTFSCRSGSYVNLKVVPIIAPITPVNNTQDIYNNNLPSNCIWISLGLPSFSETTDNVGRIVAITGMSNWISGGGSGACSNNTTVYTTKATITGAACSTLATTTATSR